MHSLYAVPYVPALERTRASRMTGDLPSTDATSVALLLDALREGRLRTDDDRSSALSRLPSGELSVLLAWDLAATLGPSEGRLDADTDGHVVVRDLDGREAFTADIVEGAGAARCGRREVVRRIAFRDRRAGPRTCHDRLRA
jgi:hypothetical protein